MRGLETIVRVWVHLRRDRVAQDTNPFDLDLHDVPGFEIARWESVADRLADRPTGDRTPTKHVARNDSAVPRSALDHCAPAVIHDAGVVLHPLDAVHFQRAAHVQAAVADKGHQLICRHDPGAQRARRVLPFGGPEARLHLVALEVATAPVVKDGEAGNVRESVRLGDIAGFPADDRSQLQLVIELFRSGWVGHGVLWTENAKRVREVENRQPIPSVGELPCSSSAGMSLVHHEVAYGWRLQDRRPQANVAQRYTLPGAR